MTIGPRPNGAAAHGAPVAPAEPPRDSTGPQGATADPVVRARVKKAPSAFRTISEVADDLHIPQHVLRFWETKFPQVRPLKRGGGRRYYRPDDIALLKRISGLLYIQGFTIKGVQRLLREGGGRLSDDIPAPRDDERQGSADDPDLARDPELPLPGLAVLTAASSRGHPAAQALTIRGAGSGPAGAAPAEDEALHEVTRLRRVLAETLVELEALRAMLP